MAVTVGVVGLVAATRPVPAAAAVERASGTRDSGKIVSFPEAEVPPGLREQVHALQRQAWPDDEPSVPGPVHDPALDPVSLLLVVDGRVVSALDILTKEITHGGERLLARGLSSVVTDLQLRGQGHALRLVAAAREAIAASGADLGIFTCDRPLHAFYERAGWDVQPGTVLVGGTPEEPFPSDLFDKVTMAAFFTPRARRLADSFPGRRIALHPGSIDRLW